MKLLLNVVYAERPISHDNVQQRDAVCGLRNVAFKARSCRSSLSLPGDGSVAELDGFLAAATDPGTSTVSAGLLSPPAADARYARRRSSGFDDPAADASHKNLANSRRKADKPRKRKRASTELTSASNDAKTTRTADNDDQMLNVDATQDQTDDCVSAGIEAVDSSTGSATAGGHGVASAGSPLPEDLSTVRAGDGSQSPEPLNSPPPTHDSDAINHQAWLLANQTTSSASTAAAAVGVIADYALSGVPAASSVHDLEAAMNKHLPTAGSADLVDPYVGGVRPHRSAIQWISTATGSSMSGHEAAATSTLLRSMYPNQRESVIRTNVYTGGAATPTAQRQYYPASTADVQSALLTPPGATESAFISAVAPHNHAAKTPPSAGVLNHGGPAGYGLTGYGADAYAMTPPSSVSPQDALAGAVSQYALEHPVTDGFYPASSQHPHSQHLHHYHHSQLSAIKPLHYGAAGVYEHSMSYHQAAAAAAMAAGYYSSNGGGSLASYSAHYRDAMKHANVSW